MKVEATRQYDSIFFESTRWREFEMRPDDIVVATPYKAGTTWTQNIVLQLIHQDFVQRDIWGISPWLDMGLNPWDEIKSKFDAQTHRRVIKSHLPFDGLHFDTDAKYIFVGRDPRDIFMSLWNFYYSFGPELFQPIEGKDFPPLPRPPATEQELWDIWINRGYFDWESDGYPFWSVFHQTANWWEERGRPNVLFLHYANMLSDPKAEIERIAKFLEIDVDAKMVDKIAEFTSFKSMKKNADKIDPTSTLKGGAKTFFHKGKNGRWANVLSEAQLAKYDVAAEQKFTPECRRWVEEGRGGKFAHPQRAGLD